MSRNGPRARWRRERDSHCGRREAPDIEPEALLDANRARRELSENGGEKGIRTLGTISRTHAFQACSFNHSDISPFEWNQ